MNENDFDNVVRRYGIEGTRRAADTFERLMPDILRTRRGARARSFINALRQSADRAEQKEQQ